MSAIYCNMGRVNNPLFVMHLLQYDTVTSSDTQPLKFITDIEYLW